MSLNDRKCINIFIFQENNSAYRWLSSMQDTHLEEITISVWKFISLPNLILFAYGSYFLSIPLKFSAEQHIPTKACRGEILKDQLTEKKIMFHHHTIGSGKGLSLVSITWTNADLLSFGSQRKNFREIRIQILERLRSEDTTHRLMITHTIEHIGSQVKRRRSQSYKLKKFAKISQFCPQTDRRTRWYQYTPLSTSYNEVFLSRNFNLKCPLQNVNHFVQASICCGNLAVLLVTRTVPSVRWISLLRVPGASITKQNFAILCIFLFVIKGCD